MIVANNSASFSGVCHCCSRSSPRAFISLEQGTRFPSFANLTPWRLRDPLDSADLAVSSKLKVGSRRKRHCSIPETVLNFSQTSRYITLVNGEDIFSLVFAIALECVALKFSSKMWRNMSVCRMKQFWNLWVVSIMWMSGNKCSWFSMLTPMVLRLSLSWTPRVCVLLLCWLFLLGPAATVV